MRLINAAKHFDKLTCKDAYAPSNTFKAQFSLFDDSVRDGATVDRRIISVAPDVSIPARRVVEAEGQAWIVGDVAPDYFGDAAIRHKYAVHRCDGLAAIKTIQQALQAAPGVSAYGALLWVKGAKEVEVSSGIYDVFNLYFSTTESVTERSLVSLVGRWYLTRTVFKSAAGFQVAVVDELPEPALETATFSSKTYDPVTDSDASVNTSVAALRIRWQSSFEYLSLGSEKYERGDMQVMVLKTVTPKTLDNIALSDGLWRIVSVLDEGDCWSLHVRRF